MRPAVRPPPVLRARRTPALIVAMASLAAAAAAAVVAPRAGAAPGPLDPAAAHATFATEPGLSVDLIAAEPVVRSPAALAWDEQGRLHVAENPDYPVGPAPGQNPQGAIVRLTDTDGDGRPDQRAVLAEGLRYPNGLMPWRGGWLVTDAPDLLWLCDTNHDARADLREVWFTGFATNQTTQLRANAPTLGPDGWIYVARGLVGGTITSPRWPRLKPVDLQAGDFRFRPDGSAAEAIGGNAQFGLVLDDVGRRFLVSNRNPLMHAVLDPRWWARHPWLPLTEVVQDVSPTGYEAKVFPRSLDTTTAGFMPEFLAAPHAGTFTSACGIHQHFGGGLGAEREGSWLICEPAQNLVQRQIATPRGATFSSRRATESGEFLTSTDPWFHPVFATTGPDGAVYLADFYRGMIDHPEYLPADVRPRMDFNAGKERGRLWRVRATPRDPRRPAALPGTNPATWSLALAHSNLWTRQTAHRLLLEHAEASDVRLVLQDFHPPSAPPAGAAASATQAMPEPDAARVAGDARRVRLLVGMLPLRTVHDQLDATDHEAILGALHLGLQAASSDVREATLRALADPGLSRVVAAPLNRVQRQRLGMLLVDPDPAVRFQALQASLAYGGIADQDHLREAYSLIGMRSEGDRWARALTVVALRGAELDTLRLLLTGSVRPHPEVARHHQALFADLAYVLGANPKEDARGMLQLVLAVAVATPPLEPPMIQAVLQGFAHGLRTRGAGPLAAFLERENINTAFPEGVLTQFQALTDVSLRLANDHGTPEEARVAAIRFLAELPAAKVRQPLLDLVEDSHPPAVRLAALRALGFLAAPGTAAHLTEAGRWRRLTPALQQEALAALTSQSQLLPELLDALEAGRLPPWSISPSQRRTLIQHRDEAVRRRAHRLFDQPGGASRQQVYESLKPLASRPGRADAGREVFQRACASCHRHGPLGVQVGPDLTGVRNQPPEALLLHIIVPDAEIYPGSQAYDLETRDGRSLTGLVVAENANAVTLRRAGGGEETLSRAQIASLSLSQVSLMPQELEKTMTETELTDLLAFLRAVP